jgi:hypothetical protein
MSNEVEIEMTVQDILEGSAFKRSIKIKSSNPNYDNKTIFYRALTGEEFAKAMEKSGLSKDQDPSDSFRFLIEVCKIGIVTTGIGAKAGSLDTDIISTIGAAVLGVSDIKEKAVEKFREES